MYAAPEVSISQGSTTGQYPGKHEKTVYLKNPGENNSNYAKTQRKLGVCFMFVSQTTLNFVVGLCCSNDGNC